jgi:hypothetical protein
MAVAVKNKKKRGMRSHGKLPTKRTINLAILGEKPMRFGLAIPAILLIIVAAAVFSKFLVLDRFAEVDAARATVYDLQRRVDAGYAELADFDDLADLYAHYTYSGFTSEELNRSGRPAIMQLIRDTGYHQPVHCGMGNMIKIEMKLIKIFGIEIIRI